MTHQRFYLELLEEQAVPPVVWPDGFALIRDEAPPPELCRRLYRDVGEGFEWTDRARWTDDEWRAHVAAPDVVFGILQTADKEPAGYFELRREASRTSVEVAYFGLLPAYIGRGLGECLLSAAVAEARGMGASRVWLHTCTKDHPHALGNYQARGFQVFMVQDL